MSWKSLNESQSWESALYVLQNRSSTTREGVLRAHTNLYLVFSRATTVACLLEPSTCVSTRALTSSGAQRNFPLFFFLWIKVKLTHELCSIQRILGSFFSCCCCCCCSVREWTVKINFFHFFYCVDFFLLLFFTTRLFRAALNKNYNDKQTRAICFSWKASARKWKTTHQSSTPFFIILWFIFHHFNQFLHSTHSRLNSTMDRKTKKTGAQWHFFPYFNLNGSRQLTGSPDLQQYSRPADRFELIHWFASQFLTHK